MGQRRQALKSNRPPEGGLLVKMVPRRGKELNNHAVSCDASLHHVIKKSITCLFHVDYFCLALSYPFL
jgi:hypothetical protein